MAVHTVVRSNFKVDFGDGIPLDVGDEGKQSVLPDIKSQFRLWPQKYDRPIFTIACPAGRLMVAQMIALRKTRKTRSQIEPML